MGSCPVQFRIHERLLYFLTTKVPSRVLDRSFPDTATIKDALESLGIPHTEVDVIIVRNRSVDFSYRMRPCDLLEMYPHACVFDSPVTRLIPPLPAEKKFIADVHLGRLCRIMRLCGFDTAYRNDYTDQEIADRAVLENRIVLSRDRNLLKRSSIKLGCCVRSDDWREQTREIMIRFNLAGEMRPFTICLNCNGRLSQVAKAEVVDQLEEKTKHYYETFSRCGSCGKIYWEGSHYQALRTIVERLSSCDR
jgi:hypothetical protein